MADPLDLAETKARARQLRVEGGGYSHDEAARLERLIAEVESLRAALVAARANPNTPLGPFGFVYDTCPICGVMNPCQAHGTHVAAPASPAPLWNCARPGCGWNLSGKCGEKDCEAVAASPAPQEPSVGTELAWRWTREGIVAPAPSGWQPIETAPMDNGNEILFVSAAASHREGPVDLQEAWQEWRHAYNARHPMTKNEAFVAGEAFAAAFALQAHREGQEQHAENVAGLEGSHRDSSSHRDAGADDHVREVAHREGLEALIETWRAKPAWMVAPQCADELADLLRASAKKT